MHIELTGLRKVYGGGKVALDGLDIAFSPGVTGLIGPNGSGKTTLLRLLATTLAPTGGSIHWNGVDAVRKPDALRRDLLYVPQNFAGYPLLGAREFLEYLARLRGVGARAARTAAFEALEIVGLREDSRRALGTFTPGMLGRLAIAYVLQSDARVLLLDEPTAGLDPFARKLLCDAVRARAGERIAILCTHIFDDLDALADRIVALRAGRIAEDGPRRDLSRIYSNVFDAASAS